MITQWKVIQNVANRYGNREDKFADSADKLLMVKEGEIPLMSLEDDMNRVKWRLARERGPLPLALERLMGIENFQDKYVLDKLSKMAHAVCRLSKKGTPIGTGFLVARNIIITNHHVINSREDSADMLAEFDYELNEELLPKKSACFKLDHKKFFLTSSLELDKNIPNTGLDFTLIGLEERGTAGESIFNYKPIYLDGNQGKIIKGEGCVILQHPNGLPKKVVLKDIAFFSETGTRLIYESDTLPGSSGSMVVGLGTCEIIALHHCGLPRTDSQNRVLTKSGALATPDTPDSEIDWLGNEGIKISRIVRAIAEADLPPEMEIGREELLQKTGEIAREIKASLKGNKEEASEIKKPLINAGLPQSRNQDSTALAEFLITAVYTPEVINQIEIALAMKYQKEIKLTLAMPVAADAGEVELFAFQAPVTGNASEEAQKLITIPAILNAEADTPLRLNADPGLISTQTKQFDIESSEKPELEFEEKEEEDFKEEYQKKNKSKYVFKKEPSDFRKWNWAATAFDKAIQSTNVQLPREKGVRIVQFDTGYTKHSKVANGFDLDQDFDFLDPAPEDGALDELSQDFGKHPGHGTRTGSLLIGNEHTVIPNDGNFGLLTRCSFKLVPYKIAETVVILGRQQQLAAALDKAIYQGFDIVTMSMGLPPTIATAKMAKKAYDKGVIWCCAAGNVVQAVVAPAVFPGTIAVAASNPMDRDWSGSSRGDTVDITAPGEDVYVPVWKNNALGKTSAEAFAYGNGTSYAVPHVAAAAAYWLATYQDTLSAPPYAGWRRVEAFRQALRKSARKENQLPREGFGAGILNTEKLLITPPEQANKLKYAYNDWNEHTFFASLQGYEELLKTYWNRLHGWIFGTRRGQQESLVMSTPVLSSFSAQLEQTLFTTRANTLEATEQLDFNQLLLRFQTVQNIVQKSAK